MNDIITNCPWDGYPAATFPTCETRICAWIQQPGNSLSNIGFFLIGFYLIYLFYKKKSPSGFNFGICTLYIGLASFAAHSARIPFFGFLDFAAIFSAFCMHATYSLTYKHPLKFKNHFKIFLVMYFATASILYIFQSIKEILFAVFVLALIYSEHRILKSEGRSLLSSSFKKVMLTFFVSAFFLVLDMNKVWCMPDNHFFQFHMIWHVMCAISLYFLAKHIDTHRLTKLQGVD